MFNNHRNNKIDKKYLNIELYYEANNDYIEINVVKGKDGNNYIIKHIRRSDNDGSLSFRGEYQIYNNRETNIGYLKYMFHYDKVPTYMVLCDIEFNRVYRNIGIGSKVIALFEERSKEYGAHYIEGNLSSVDEQSKNDTTLRNQFYIRRGYEIRESKIYKSLI